MPEGFPRVALDLKVPFKRYVFIERDSERAQALCRLAEEYCTTRKSDVRQGGAHTELSKLAEGDLQREACRAVVFLDPYGMDVAWNTMAKLGRTRNCEVIVNFPLGMAARRLLPRDGEPPPDWQKALTRLFGSDRWLAEAYQDRPDLFGEGRSKRTDAERRLLRLYQQQLRNAFGYASPARPIFNTRRNLLYHLIWAGPHELGLKIATDVFRSKLPRDPRVTERSRER